jgi:glyoxylase-like metal-dependent hydrolase (beta-lactamase superfamily II)
MKIHVLKVGELKANCYIVEHKDSALIIDPGAEVNRIVSKIKELDLKIVGVLVTHEHFDHCTYAKELSELYNVQIYDYNNLFEKKQFISPFRFKTIYVPGHSPQSIIFYFYDFGVMFVGDFVFKGTIGRVDIVGGSYKEIVKSITKIKKYDDNILLYPGHGEYTTLGDEKKYNPYFN